MLPKALSNLPSENSKQKASVFSRKPSSSKQVEVLFTSSRKQKRKGFQIVNDRVAQRTAQANFDKALLPKGLNYEDSGTTVLKMNKKKSFSFDARELRQALTNVKFFIKPSF